MAAGGNANDVTGRAIFEAETVTYDFARLMDGATKVKCSAFADEMIRHMG